MTDNRSDDRRNAPGKRSVPSAPGNEAPKPGRSLRITKHTYDAERDVRDEVELYLEMRTQELVEQGLDPAEARRTAQEAFGDREHIEGELREITAPGIEAARRTELFGSFFRDIRFAVRSLIKKPGFAVVTCLTLAICIGANAAVFSVVNGVVLRPLPYPEADRLLTVFNIYPQAGVDRGMNSAPDFFDRRELDAFEDVALYTSQSVTLGEGAAAANVFSMWVSTPFFEVINVEPILGRGFTEEEGVPGNAAVVVISYGLWQTHFGGAENVIGDLLETQSHGPLAVVGVMPEGFQFPTWDAQVWGPLAFGEEARTAYHSNNWNMVGRLKPGATVEQAQEQIDALNASLIAAYPVEVQHLLTDAGYATIVRGFQDDLVADYRAPLFMMWASVAFVLLVGAFNIANLLLVRSASRLQELATRFVLGASRWRIARQLLTETLVLNIVGGAIGLALGAWSLRFLNTFEYYQVPRLNEVAADWQTALFTLGLAVAVAWFASLVPALAIRRGDLYGVFRSGASNVQAGSSGSSRRLLSVRSVLIVGQVAVAFVLLAGGALLLASLMNLWSVDPGFVSDDLMAGAIAIPGVRYPNAVSRISLVDSVARELAALPGSRGAALANQLPFSGTESSNVFTPEGYVRDPGDAIVAHFQTIVTPGYFETMGIPLLSGRAFGIGDTFDSPPVLIVDERIARKYWPGEDPLGKRVFFDITAAEDNELATVVGVVGEVLQNDLDDADPNGGFYRPYAQVPTDFMRIVVRHDVDAAGAIAAIRERIRGLDSEMPVFWMQTMNDSVAERLIPRRIPMMVVLSFAGVALLLTMIGVYGVLAYAVAQRTKEIGIRVALGCTERGVYSLMFRQAAAVIGIGLVLGLGLSLVSARFLASQLYEVQPADPVVLGLVAIVITTVALLACLVPTWRATRVDPVVALRTD